MALPIIFIHQTDASFIEHTVAQAKRFNPQSPIHFIGDASNSWHPGVTHHQISDYFEDARKFRRIYLHLNGNGYHYELFCFQRWFILRDFAKRHGIASCLYIDTDVMLYANAAEQMDRYPGAVFTVSRVTPESGASPHCLFIRDTQVLGDFCAFLQRRYRSPRILVPSILAHLRHRRIHKGGGYCDMTALREFITSTDVSFANTSDIVDGTVVDDNISDSAGYKMAGGAKRVIWRAGQPYGYHLASDTWIRFVALHFQGPSKGLISEFRSDRHIE